MLFRKLLAAIIASMSLVGVAKATELRVLASWDDSAPSRNILLQNYLKNVEAASKGDITFKVSGPETVPAFEQLQPVSTGVFQRLFTTHSRPTICALRSAVRNSRCANRCSHGGGGAAGPLTLSVHDQARL
jgi:hypothetical protein